MTTNLQIETFESDHVLPLFEESQGQEGPAYLYLDTRDGEVYVRGVHPAYSNSWGVDEHNGHVIRWRIQNNLTVTGINELLSDIVVIERLQTIVSGSEQYYDGNNYRTKITEEALDAREQLERHFADSEYSALDVWDATMWIGDAAYSDLVQDGETHDHAAQRLEKQALSERVYCPWFEIEKALDAKKQTIDDEAEEN